MNNDMNEPSQIEIALEIALKAHKGQRDLDGKLPEESDHPTSHSHIASGMPNDCVPLYIFTL